MTDPVALAAAPAELVELSAARPAQAPPFDPVETRMFTNLMQGALPPAATAGGPNSFHDAALAVAAQLSGQHRSFDEMRRSMLESVDLRDPIQTMFAMTDHALEAQALFSKLHIATGLASAATSLFGGLLKNQG